MTAHSTAIGDLLRSRGFAAILFDMDGTILSSIAATERVWTAWAERHGLHAESFVPTIHGVRAVETVRRLGLPGVDPEREAADLTRAEMADVGGIEAIEGAAAFLASLAGKPWAVVTSAPRALFERRLAAAGLPMPPVVVTAEDVTRGKPAPDCFQLAARRLGVDIEACLIFEDAPAGIEAAEAAGATVAVITATHRHPIETAHPALAGYGELALASDDGPIRLVRAAEGRKD